MALLDELKELGADVDAGTKRMMGNTALYQKVLVSLAEIIRDFSDSPEAEFKDIPAAIEKTHKIKGSAGNLSITPLYEAYCEMLNALRAGDPESAKAIYNHILPVQNEILACIDKYTEA